MIKEDDVPTDHHKQRGGLALIVVSFLIVAMCLVLLGILGPKAGMTVTLSIVVILVTSGIAATLNSIKTTRSEGQRSNRQRTAVAVVLGLFGISIGAMLVLVSITEPLELIKTALSSVIVLAGAGVTAVLAMLRSDEAKASADASTAEARTARERADESAAEARGAQEKADEGAAEARGAREKADESASEARTARRRSEGES